MVACRWRPQFVWNRLPCPRNELSFQPELPQSDLSSLSWTPHLSSCLLGYRKLSQAAPSSDHAYPSIASKLTANGPFALPHWQRFRTFYQRFYACSLKCELLRAKCRHGAYVTILSDKICLQALFLLSHTQPNAHRTCPCCMPQQHRHCKELSVPSAW